MFFRRPILTGKVEFEQLSKIFELLGTPQIRDWGDFPRNAPHWKDLCSAYDPENPQNQQQAVRIESNLRNMLGTSPSNKVSEEGKNLIEGLLALNPDMRLGAANAITHTWFYEHPAVKQSNQLNMDWRCQSVHESEAKEAKALKRQQQLMAHNSSNSQIGRASCRERV